MRFARITYAVIAAGAALWCLTLILPSLLAASGEPSDRVRSIVEAFYRPVCHQLDDRSFHFFDVPLAVCSRCASIYFGFLTGTLLFPLFNDIRRPVMPGRLILAVALAPMLADVAAAMLGFHVSTMIMRAVTGGWFGLLAPFVVLPGAISGIGQLCVRSVAPLTQPEKGLTDA
ncbi:MAG: DUF2085 domain-containing protein [Bacteroidota bacterium]